jgi:hypothetical protein
MRPGPRVEGTRTKALAAAAIVNVNVCVRCVGRACMRAIVYNTHKVYSVRDAILAPLGAEREKKRAPPALGLQKSVQQHIHSRRNRFVARTGNT